MYEKPLKNVLRDLAEEQISSKTDLWPRIRSRVKPGRVRTIVPDVSISLVVLFILVVITLATPQGRAWAQSLFGYFERATSDPIIPTSIPQESLAPAVIPPAASNAEQGPPFDIMLPTMLPEGWTLALIGPAQADGEVHISFDFDFGSNPKRWLDLYMQTADELVGTVWGPAGEVEAVQVGQYPGEFVSGVWLALSGQKIVFQALPDETADLEWGLIGSFRRLRWEVDGVMYWLVARGGEPGIPGYLAKPDLIVIGESLAPAAAGSPPIEVETFVPDGGGSEVANIVPAENLDLADFLAKVDFPALVPTVLPENYTFTGWYYEAGWVPAEMRFDCGVQTSMTWYQLAFTQSPIPVEEMQFGSRGALRQAVGAAAVIETVQIGDVEGHYAQGGWFAIMDPVTHEHLRNEWVSEMNAHHLFWYRDGILYRISPGGGPAGDIDTTDVASYNGPCRLDKFDLIAFAEGLQ
jgi:hypothetical protein